MKRLPTPSVARRPVRALRLPVLAFAVLAGCGGGGSSGPGDTSFTGTAATGAPMAGAPVEVRCRSGAGSGTTGANGAYSVTIAGGATGPCLLKANGNGEELISATASAGGTANVTPLTHLMTAKLLGTAPRAGFDNPVAAVLDKISSANLSAAQGQVTQEILRIGAQMPSADWVLQPFTAAAPDAMDGALELLKRKLTDQSKTTESAAIELAAGPLQVIAPTPPVVDCVPGLISGFSGPLRDDVAKVLRPTSPTTGEGEGIGGGAGTGGADGVGIGGALGQFLSVDVTVEFANGTRFGPVRTDATKGMVTLVPCNLAPPALVTFTGATGSGASYYDEGAGQVLSFEGQTLRGIVSRFDRNGGVTPFTEAMVALALSGAPTNPTGFGPDSAVLKAADSWKDAGRVQASHDAVLRAVNDLLPGIYRIEDLRRLPVIVNATNDQGSSQVLSDNQNGVYGAVVAGLAVAARTVQATGTRPALDIQKQLASDLADGVLDRRAGATPVATAAGTGTFSYDTFGRQLTSATGATARKLGAGGLAGRVTVVQRLRGRAGVTTTATPNWVFTLQSDGKLVVTPPAGATAPSIPSSLRFARIDVFDRSSKTRPPASPTPPAADNWQTCFVATTADGASVLSWRVGIATGFETITPPQPVLGIAPDGLSAPTGSGGDSLLFVGRNGTLNEIRRSDPDGGNDFGVCDRLDQHPGVPGQQQLPANNPAVQVLQDFGNRYVLFADGTVNAWGIRGQALGIAFVPDPLEPNNTRVEASAFTPVKAPTATTPDRLTNVVMLARGEDQYMPRALTRSSQTPALDGAVFAWGNNLPRPRQITGLPKICWISGPYAVACDGGLWYATWFEANGAVRATPRVVKLGDDYWRVNESARLSAAAAAGTSTTTQVLEYRAVSRQGTVFRLEGEAAPVAE